MSRLIFAAVAAIWASVAIASPPPGCDSPVPVNEYATDYRCAGNVRAVSSDGRPANIPDGRGGWREPVLAWQRGPVGYELATLPGPLVYRAEREWLVIEDRSGNVQGAIEWAITRVDGPTAHFRWLGHDCTLTAERLGLKFACAITEHLGQATLAVATRGAWSTDENRDALAGLFRIPAPVLIAGEVDYHNLAHWRVGADTLEIVLDDRVVPLPYVIDPNFGPNYPGTCATATGVGTIAWTNPTNAQASDNTRATSSLTSLAQSNWLKCTNYGFTTTPLSDDKVIKGIVAESEVQQSGTSIKIQDIRAVKATTIQTTSRATGGCITNWTAGSDTFRTCGGSLDLWGTTWAPSDIRDSGFGVALSAKNNTTTTRTASVDTIRVTIYYSPPAGRTFITGWDSSSAEDGTATVAGSSTITYSGAAARTGVRGLRIVTAANSAANYCVALDNDLTNKVYVRPYIINANPIAAGESLIVGYTKADDGTVGCYAVLTRDSAGQYSVQMKFHGLETTDLNFGTYPVDATDLANFAITFGQIIEGDGASCPLYYNGELVQGISLAMQGDCAGGACDLNAVCVGTPATSAVDDYPAIPVATLDVDDLAVDNVSAPTIGSVYPLFPTGNGTLVEWSNGSCTGAGCVDDWAAGGSAGLCNSDADTRQRGSGGTVPHTDQWTLDDLPALAATDTVKAVRPLVKWCSQSGADVVLNTYLQTGADTGAGVSQTVPNGTAATYSQTYADNIASTPAAWTESQVNALTGGYEKSTTAGDARATALMVYAEVENAVPPPDQNMQDWNGDGQISIIFGCDSITAGTKSSTCYGSGNCAEACTTSADCQAGGTCSPGNCSTGSCCSYACERTEDCTCGAGAICLTSIMWVNQLSSKLQQADNLFNCGRDTMPLKSWWENVLPDVLASPYSHSINGSPGGPCSLVRGAWGYCSSTSTQSCATDSDCPSGQTCNPNEPDYVADLCGGNDLIGLGPGECKVSFGYVPSGQDRWKRQACPQASVSPSGYQTTRTTCTVDANCPAGSACKGYCEGHTDPLWSCRNDYDCGTCADDTTKFCYHQGSCQNNGGCAIGGNCCDVDADCPSGTGCLAYAGSKGTWDAGTWGVSCATCEHRDCLTDVKYCVPQCSDVTCSTDADCGATGGTGGICDGGTCRGCGTQIASYTGTRDAKFDLLVSKRLAGLNAPTTAEKILSIQNGATATVEGAGARRIVGTYAESFQTWALGQSSVADISELFVRKAKTELRSLENVVDLHNAIRTRDDRNLSTNGVLLVDGVHNFSTGASVVGDLWNSYLTSLYPVCTLDTAKPCAFCDVACTTDTQCNRPVGAGTPTPIPTPGACRTATPGVKVCGCSVDADCGPGLQCLDVNSGAGTDKRCVSYDVDLCPAGDGTAARKLAANDYACSQQAAGTCDKERTRPRCTNRQEVECATSADCLGIAKGDICAADGVLLSCQLDMECRSAGRFAHDVCAPATPIPAGSPTAKSRWCAQPTMTSTPTP